MKTIAFYNNKGGVGKTTLAANVAYNLSAGGNKVLLIDCDPQGNLSSFFGRYDLTKKSLYDALTTSAHCIYRTSYPSLDILPGNINTEKLYPRPEAIKKLLKYFDSHYDWCILDCAPAYSELTASALNAAQIVLIPIKLDNFSIEGIDTTLSRLADPSIAHVVINAYAPTKAGKDFIKKLTGSYDYPLCKSLIRHSAMVDAANYRKKPMARKARYHRVTQDMMELTGEVCGYGISQ